MKATRIKQEGDKVLFVFDGKGDLLEPEVAKQIGRALLRAGCEASEIKDAAAVIHSQAFALRSKFPFGFSHNPIIESEARKEAAHNPELRKMIPHTPEVRTRTLGVPTVAAVEDSNATDR